MSDQVTSACFGSTIDAASSEPSPGEKAVYARSVSSKVESVSQVGTTIPGACTPRTVATVELASTPPQIHIYTPDCPQHQDEDECNSSHARASTSNPEIIKRPTSRSSIRGFLKGASQSLRSRATFSSLSSKSSTKSSIHTSNEAANLPYGQNTSQMISHSASIYPPEGVQTSGPSTSTLPTVERSALIHPGTVHKVTKNRSPPPPHPQQTHLQIIHYDTEPDGTSSQTWHEQTSLRVPSRPLSRLSLGSVQLAPIETPRSHDAAQGFPNTPTSPNSGRDRDGNLRAQWASWQNQEEPWCDEHKVLAKAVALYDWNGVIPSRRTQGFPLKEGCIVEICNILNKAWYQVHHEGKCEYLPSEYVQITEFSDDASSKLFEEYRKPPKAATNAHVSPEPSSSSAPTITPTSQPKPTVWEPIYYYSMWKKLSRRSTRKKPAVNPREPPPVAKKKKERPNVPLAPFDREPHDFERNQNRVVISMKCRQFLTGVAITFSVTLIPAPQWRFTTFRFAAELPAGQVIIGIYPQRVVGSSTNVHHNDARKHELAITAKGGYMGSGLELGQTQGSSQEVEYMRKTRVAIVGGGVNSGKATWNATEDVANQSGLDNRLELSILLPTAKPPPQIKCYYAAKLGKSTQVFTSTQAVDRFENRCEFNFTS